MMNIRISVEGQSSFKTSRWYTGNANGECAADGLQHPVFSQRDDLLFTVTERSEYLMGVLT